MKKTKLIIKETQYNKLKSLLVESYSVDSIITVLQELPDNVRMFLPTVKYGMSIEIRDKNDAIEQVQKVNNNDPNGGEFKVWSFNIDYSILGSMDIEDRRRLSDLKRTYNISYDELKPYLPYINLIKISYESDFSRGIDDMRRQSIDRERKETGSGGIYTDD